MKVFHGPQNISGMASILAEAQRTLGIDAEAHCVGNPVFGYRPDAVFRPGSLKDARQVARFASRFDVFHFYFGESLDGKGLRDLPVLKAMGKKVFMYFCGCDVRDSRHVIATREVSACAGCWPSLCSRNRSLALAAAEKYADGIFVSTPDLLETVPRAVLLPQPFKVDSVSHIRRSRQPDAAGLGTPANPLRLVHAPSSQSIKGTRHVFEAVEKLRAGGLAIDLVLVEKTSWEEALRIYASAHLAVDQLLIGAYGSLSVELMALGVPVICYLHEGTSRHYPEPPPIINASPRDLAEVIVREMGRSDRWHDLSRRALRYVTAHHESGAVARQAIDRYERTASCAS